MIRILIIAIVSTFLLIPIAGYSSNIIKNDFLLIATSFFTGYVLIPILLMRLWPTSAEKEGAESFETAMAKGKVKITEYDIFDVVMMEDEEDEELHILMSIAPSRTLSLAGAYLYPYAASKTFPSDKVRIVSNIHRNICYGIESVGNKIKARRVKTVPGSEAWGSGVVPYDLEIVEKPLDEVVKEIEQYA